MALIIAQIMQMNPVDVRNITQFMIMHQTLPMHIWVEKIKLVYKKCSDRSAHVYDPMLIGKKYPKKILFENFR